MVASSSCGTPIQQDLRSLIQLFLSTHDSKTHDWKIRRFSFRQLLTFIEEKTKTKQRERQGCVREKHTINVFKSALSFGFLFKHRSMKSMKASLNIPDGNLGGGSLTINSNNSNTANGLGVYVPTIIKNRQLTFNQHQEHNLFSSCENKQKYSCKY